MADETNKSVLLPVDIEAEMRKSYLDYAMSVIIARALPDVRDGLKPVQRRILVAMNDLGLASNRGYRSEEHTSELQSRLHPVCRLLLEKKKQPWTRSSTNPANTRNATAAGRARPLR